MSFVRFYHVVEDDSDDEPVAKYSSFVDLEEFEEDPKGFSSEKPGSEIDPVPEDRGHVKPWEPSENFFSYI
jgi:hypothetical protein